MFTARLHGRIPGVRPFFIHGPVQSKKWPKVLWISPTFEIVAPAATICNFG
jgi:hypothetical protein